LLKFDGKNAIDDRDLQAKCGSRPKILMMVIVYYDQDHGDALLLFIPTPIIL